MFQVLLLFCLPKICFIHNALRVVDKIGERINKYKLPSIENKEKKRNKKSKWCHVHIRNVVNNIVTTL